MTSDRTDDCGLAALGLAFYCVGGIGVALLPNSILRVVALVVLGVGSDIHDLVLVRADEVSQGALGCSRIALVSSIGTSGGFFGPSIIGFLKQATGSDSGAFLGLRALLYWAPLSALDYARPQRSAPDGE